MSLLETIQRIFPAQSAFLWGGIQVNNGGSRCYQPRVTAVNVFRHVCPPGGLRQKVALILLLGGCPLSSLAGIQFLPHWKYPHWEWSTGTNKHTSTYQHCLGNQPDPSFLIILSPMTHHSFGFFSVIPQIIFLSPQITAGWKCIYCYRIELPQQS